MDLNHAIEAHSLWKTKFRTAITKQESLDASTIGADNCCELGKWLYGEGRGLYGAKPQFTALLQKHKGFHAEAGKVAKLINAKQFSLAEEAISQSCQPKPPTCKRNGYAVWL